MSPRNDEIANAFPAHLCLTPPPISVILTVRKVDSVPPKFPTTANVPASHWLPGDFSPAAGSHAL